MDPEIVDTYPRNGSGERADWVGGRLAMLYPDRPDVAGRLSAINRVRFLDPNRGKRRLNFGTFLVGPTVA